MREVGLNAVPRPRLPLTFPAAAVGALVLLLGLWVWFVAATGGIQRGPNGVLFGNSFGTYLGAANTLRHGGNPYDPKLLYHNERALLGRQHIPVQEPLWNSHVGNPPLFFWALEPLTELPYRPVAWFWILLMWGTCLAGMLALLRLLGWKSRWQVAVGAAVMPPVLLGVYYGEVYPVMFAALGGGLLLARRHPFAAGMVLSLFWLKPSIGLPMFGLVALFHTTSTRRILVGFGSATGLLIALTVLTTGARSLQQWVTAMLFYSRDIQIQPHLASLSALYAHWAPPALSMALEVGAVGVFLALTARALLAARDDRPIAPARIAWLWVVMFLAVPYAQYYDQMFLALPVFVLLGVDARRMAQPSVAIAILALLLSVLLSSWLPFEVDLLPLPVVFLGLLLCRSRMSRMVIAGAG